MFTENIEPLVKYFKMDLSLLKDYARRNFEERVDFNRSEAHGKVHYMFTKASFKNFKMKYATRKKYNRTIPEP